MQKIPKVRITALYIPISKPGKNGIRSPHIHNNWIYQGDYRNSTINLTTEFDVIVGEITLKIGRSYVFYPVGEAGIYLESDSFIKFGI